MAVAQVGRRVFDEDLASEKILRDLDVAAHDGQRFLGERQGEQVGEMRTVDGVPREMLGDEARLDSLHEGSDAAQMALVEPFGAAEGEADAMQRERIIATDGVEICERRSTAK